MDLSKIPSEWLEAGGGKESVPVITHCGGGGRGQKAKDYLESQVGPARGAFARRATRPHYAMQLASPALPPFAQPLKAVRCAPQGFKNVLNGGGPEDDECWAVFGSL